MMTTTCFHNAGQPPVKAWIVPEYLAEMDPGGQCGLTKELIGLFIAEGFCRMDRLRAAASAGDFVTLASESHLLRGSALQMNAISLAELVTEIEQDAKARRTVDYVAAVEHLETLFNQVREAMAALR